MRIIKFLTPINYRLIKFNLKDTIHKQRITNYSILNRMEDSFKTNLKNIGLHDKAIDDILTKKKYAERIKFVLSEAKVESCDYEIGHAICIVAEKLNPAYNHRLPLLMKYVLSKKLINPHQIDTSIEFIKEKGDLNLTDEEFEKRVGIGIVITEKDIQKAVDDAIKTNSEVISKERYKFPSTNLLYEVKKGFPYLDGKLAKKILDESIDKFLGGKSKEEKEEDNMRSEMENLKKKSKDKKNKLTEEETKRFEDLKLKIKQIDDNFHKSRENNEEKEMENNKLAKLMARDMKSALNSEEILKKHLEFTKGKVFTRFPPEPNGYLHIGHAKAMRFSFHSADVNGGNCYLRFDDTNPEKETKEFIDNIAENVNWLGYKPYKTTFASDYFEDLYNLAIELIKRGKAFVCHQTKLEMNEYREKKLDSPYRNRSVEENLKLFTMMRQGRFEEKECCLRMKIDMKHNNPCMRDPVAYRIKYVPHPHAGDKWCIYPTYDYTHCLNDSLENITHSLCTLEFEIRRDSYYWLLEALDIYRPFVWEYSRLNLTRNVLSKRKLTQLVYGNYVKGWDDPRLLTLNGLRRRGYTPQAINTFVDTIGVTRRGNDNLLSIKLLEHCIRADLDKGLNKAARTLAVVDPIKVILNNLSDEKEIETLIYPMEKDNSEKRKVTLTKVIYIERTDFRVNDDEDFYGLIPGKEVGLKYAGYIKCVEVVKELDTIKELICEYYPESKKTKGRIHWVSEKDSLRCEVRLYDYLFNSENPAELAEPLNDINPNSLTIRNQAIVNKLLVNEIKLNRKHFQFERLGYFVVDKDSNIETNKLIFNLTVDLGDDKNKKI